jgi:alpha-tubulin suppressor-like RCC1 family protein
MCAILDNDKVKCWGYNNHGELGQGDRVYRGNDAGEMGDNLPYVDLGSGRTALMIDTGHYHACALLDNHEIKCWGRGSYGNLGNASTAHRGDGAGETGDNIPNVVLGSNDKPLAIYAAGNHSCAVLETNEVKCWGYNNSGQLGHGHRYNVGTDYLSLGDNLPTSE